MDASARCVQPLTQEIPRPVLTMINLLPTAYVQLIRDRRMKRPCNGYLEMCNMYNLACVTAPRAKISALSHAVFMYAQRIKLFSLELVVANQGAFCRIP